MDIIEEKYNQLCNKSSDINEHLPTLYRYSTECESVIELGVRGCVSSWAFVNGLLHNNKNKKKILMNDLTDCDINNLLEAVNDLDIEINYEWKNDLDIEVNENYDLTFIDTWHVYGQLKRELEKFSKITNKYIIMHDTTVDEWEGETIRCMGGRRRAEIQSQQTGIPVDEIMKGLWYAVEEFLDDNEEWKLLERYTNNNGLTILERIN